MLQQHEQSFLNIKYTKQFIQSNPFKIYTEYFQSFSVSRVNAVTHCHNPTRQVISVLLPPQFVHSGNTAFSRSVNSFPKVTCWCDECGRAGIPAQAGWFQYLHLLVRREQRKIRARCRAESAEGASGSGSLFSLLSNKSPNVSRSVFACRVESQAPFLFWSDK